MIDAVAREARWWCCERCGGLCLWAYKESALGWGFRKRYPRLSKILGLPETESVGQLASQWPEGQTSTLLP
jgi:hypothetical protein